MLWIALTLCAISILWQQQREEPECLSPSVCITVPLEMNKLSFTGLSDEPFTYFETDIIFRLNKAKTGSKAEVQGCHLVTHIGYFLGYTLSDSLTTEMVTANTSRNVCLWLLSQKYKLYIDAHGNNGEHWMLKSLWQFLFFSTVVKYGIFWNKKCASRLTAKHQQHLPRNSL